MGAVMPLYLDSTILSKAGLYSDPVHHHLREKQGYTKASQTWSWKNGKMESSQDFEPTIFEKHQVSSYFYPQIPPFREK